MQKSDCKIRSYEILTSKNGKVYIYNHKEKKY